VISRRFLHCLGHLVCNELNEVERADEDQLFAERAEAGVNLILIIVFDSFFHCFIGRIPDLLDCPEQLSIRQVNKFQPQSYDHLGVGLIRGNRANDNGIAVQGFSHFCELLEGVRRVRIQLQALPGRIGPADDGDAEELLFLQCLEEGFCHIGGDLRVDRVVVHIEDDDLADSGQVLVRIEVIIIRLVQ